MILKLLLLLLQHVLVIGLIVMWWEVLEGFLLAQMLTKKLDISDLLPKDVTNTPMTLGRGDLTEYNYQVCQQICEDQRRRQLEEVFEAERKRFWNETQEVRDFHRSRVHLAAGVERFMEIYLQRQFDLLRQGGIQDQLYDSSE